jgi:hypothetical protein
MAGNKNFARVGEQAFQKMDKINAEVFTLTYGSMVQQLLKVSRHAPDALRALAGACARRRAPSGHVGVVARARRSAAADAAVPHTHPPPRQRAARRTTRTRQK